MIYLKLFLTFFKIGAFTFGGGYAMLPLIQQEVLNNKWMRAEELIDFIAISESTPGPFAVNVSTYIGFEMGGIPGAICASLGVVIPSFVVILLVARAYERFEKSRIVAGSMSGLKPAVVGLIGTAVFSTAVSAFPINRDLHLWDPKLWIGLVIFAGMAFLLKKKVHPILIILISALLGILVNTFVD